MTDLLTQEERKMLETTGQVLFYKRDDPFGWLSNFERAPIVIGGITWSTTEHYYQALKSPDPDIRRWIRQAPTPWLAMKAGRALRESKGEVTTGWDQGVKFEVMLQALLAKFAQHQELRAKLLATGDAPIHENSTPETAPDGKPDMVWGILGEDRLGRLLMRTRFEMRIVGAGAP